ncbi:MAG: nitroreductase family protein [Candidatus Gracilibacteria bacterium]|jgi:nitroreductase
MFEIKNLLNRKTTRNFLPQKIENEIVENALRVAWKTPTSLNSKPVIICDISNHAKDAWIEKQQAVKTASHVFLFAVNEEVAEANAKKILAPRFGCDTDDEKVSVTFEKIVANRREWATQQIYLVASYFAATLEANGVSGCFIAGFDKSAAEKELKLLVGYKVGLVFACGYTDKENPGWQETEFARSFEEFYYPEI